MGAKRKARYGRERNGRFRLADLSNTFTVPRHLVIDRTHRLFRAEAFEARRDAAGVGA